MAESRDTPARRSGAVDARRDIDERLMALATSLNLPKEVTVGRAVLADAAPATALLAEVARIQGDLVAVGGHGHGFWKQLTFGSVASKVLRLASTCVLVQPASSVTSPAPATVGAEELTA